MIVNDLPKGTRCTGTVRINDWRRGACSKPATIIRDGKYYCGIHDPERRRQAQVLREEQARKKECQTCRARKPLWTYKYCPYCGTKYLG